ncbi:MAG: glycerophosphodiester phosphodiesterase [Nitrosomonas sp.]|nr:glycerophosphodiester phosphodiesterase [Nitrosomonas sp.]MCW5607734.1 glycerophosphodiester phosphodiesterase [Nitrosomonas sp.]
MFPTSPLDKFKPIFGRSLIFAHRGASTEAMENTRPAFDRALNYTIDGIETDVQLSRDGVAVLWHDRFLGKIDLPDKHIDDFDYAQLKTIHFPQTGSASLMTLEAFLSDYRQRCRLLIEIKNHDWEPLSRHEKKMQQTLDLIAPPDERIMVSSFDLQSLVYASQLNSRVQLVYNLDDCHSARNVQQTLTGNPFLSGFCLPIALLDQALLDLLRTQDKYVAVYTCNTETEIRKALRLGVDILISDVPDKALQLRSTMQIPC